MNIKKIDKDDLTDAAAITACFERLENMLADRAKDETMLKLIGGIFEALAKMSSANKVDIDICFDHDGDIRVTISPSLSWRLGIDEEGE